jgi:uncharacterized membrane protein
VDAHTLGWLSLVARWIHVIVGIAWIGTSFYFNWLNDQLRPPETPIEGVGGEVWSVHGGGFYRVTKFTVAPETLPKRLHWFKWEAYSTWLSGMALLVLVYYLNADLYLVDPATGIGAAAGIGISLAVLVLGWLGYDLLCRSPLVNRPTLFALIGLILVSVVAWILSLWLSDRAAYLMVGAMVGTIMAANVFFIIIPSQRAMVDAVAAGVEPDAQQGKDAALRSRHNNYLTLPVLFIMVSNHYPMTYGHPYNWVVLAGLFVAGVAVRHFFNRKNQGQRLWLLVAVAVLVLLALAIVTQPSASRPVSAAGPQDAMEAGAIIERRCRVCHSASPTYPGIAFAPAGIMFDTPEIIRALAPRIYTVAVVSRTMPLGNVTGMTEEERVVVGRWWEGVGGVSSD